MFRNLEDIVTLLSCHTKRNEMEILFQNLNSGITYSWMKDVMDSFFNENSLKVDFYFTRTRSL